ncbi:helix-turn-helix domain-containing protein [Paenibacillus sp. UNC451MF]|uniref:helix-turn-helix domain-containing protein n=1 Tax=Paenibacillus sp. UNC451MF TaxID=1449063 RepID=UPI00048F7182|nr:helix-turn-helix domain-containing protein [Paenibacillus sp. UNC451MF]
MLTVESLVRILKKPMGIIKIDGEILSFLEVNEPFCALSGYTREELMKVDPHLMLAREQSNPAFTQLENDQFLKTEVTVLSKDHLNVILEVELYLIDDGPNQLIIVFADHISSKKWIDHQIANNPILCSGVVNSSYIMTRYDMYFDPIVDHKSRFEQESIFELIAKADHPVMKKLLEEIKQTKQTKEVVLRTTKLADQLELKMKIMVRPFFDGVGTFLEYAFVISQLELFEVSADPAVRLKVLMAQRNMSAQSLSEATNITIQTISKLRNGKVTKPQLLTAQLIAGELGVAVSDIWAETRR